MRALIALLLLAIPVSALAAPKQKAQPASPCKYIADREDRRVSSKTRGYEPVSVRLVQSIPPGADPDKFIKLINLRFAIQTPLGDIRYDNDRTITGIGVCERDHIDKNGRYYPAGTVWIQAGQMTVLNREDESFTLHMTIPLPKEIVAQKPRAFTVLQSEGIFLGSWEKDDDTAVLLLKER